MFKTLINSDSNKRQYSETQLKGIKSRLLIYAMLEYERHKRSCKTV